MNQVRTTHTILLSGLIVSLVVISVSGCAAGKILRENVLASTQSTFGLQVAQNPQTQVHEFKLGYARNEFFLVPTDKTVLYEQSGGANEKECDVRSGASKTANVLAEIQVGGTSKGTEQRVTIYQRLAVGDLAVRSGAAIALYAEDEKVAKAASAGLLSLEGDAPETQAGAVIGLLSDAYIVAGAYGDSSQEKELADKVDLVRAQFPDRVDFLVYDSVGGGNFTRSGPDGSTLPGNNILVAVMYLGQLRTSINHAVTINAKAQVTPNFTLTDNFSTPTVTFNTITPDVQARVSRDIATMRERLKSTFTQLSETEEVTALIEWYTKEVLGL